MEFQIGDFRLGITNTELAEQLVALYSHIDKVAQNLYLLFKRLTACDSRLRAETQVTLQRAGTPNDSLATPGWRNW